MICVILNENYKTYKNALEVLQIESLSDHREKLCLSFANRAQKHPKFKHMFPKNDKTHQMGTKKQETFKVQHAHTDRLKDSSIIFMKNLLNKHENDD